MSLGKLVIAHAQTHCFVVAFGFGFFSLRDGGGGRVELVFMRLCPFEAEVGKFSLF